MVVKWNFLPCRGSKWFQIAQVIVPLGAAGVGLSLTCVGWYRTNKIRTEERKQLRRDSRENIKRRTLGINNVKKSIPLYGVSIEEEEQRKKIGRGTKETQKRILHKLAEAERKSNVPDV